MSGLVAVARVAGEQVGLSGGWGGRVRFSGLVAAGVCALLAAACGPAIPGSPGNDLY